MAALPWRARLPPALAAWVVGLELPGRGRRFGEPFAVSLPALARDLAATIGAMGDEAVLLQGHSMGALLAYEVARVLVAQGRAVRGLLLSGRAAPHWPVEGPPLPRHLLSDAGLVQELKRLGGTPPEVLAEPDLLALLLPLLRADFHLVESYVWEPGPALPVAATVLGGADDRATPPEALAAWGEVLAGPVAVEVWPGGHFFLNEAPDRFTRRMSQWAAEAHPAEGAF